MDMAVKSLALADALAHCAAGKEVAKFVNLKYAEVLKNLDSFKAGDYATALKESFHRIDEMLEDPVSPPSLPSRPMPLLSPSCPRPPVIAIRCAAQGAACHPQPL